MYFMYLHVCQDAQGNHYMNTARGACQRLDGQWHWSLELTALAKTQKYYSSVFQTLGPPTPAPAPSLRRRGGVEIEAAGYWH